MNRPIIALDGSGSIANADDPIVIVAWIADAETRVAKIILSRAARESTRRKGNRKPLGEFRFRRVGERERHSVYQKLIDAEIRFGILIVDKGTQAIGDTPENCTVLVGEAIAMAQNYFGVANLEIIIDGHFSSHADRQRFATLLVNALDLEEPPRFADSEITPLVQLADFVAGAFYVKYGRQQNPEYVEQLEGQRIAELRITWKELKAKWIQRF